MQQINRRSNNGQSCTIKLNKLDEKLQKLYISEIDHESFFSHQGQ